MPLTPVSLFVAIFILITPALAADQASEQEITPKLAELRRYDDRYTQEDTKKVSEIANLQTVSRELSPCICGMSSVKCCRRKRTFVKIEKAGNIVAGN